MALLFIEGFDWVENNIAGFSGEGRWSALSSTVSNYDRITDTASGSGAAARLQGTGEMSHALGSNEATVVLGFRLRLGVLPSSTLELLNFDEATAGSFGQHVTLTVTTAGLIQVRRGDNNGTILGTTTTALSASTWTYIEIKVTIDNTAGVVELRFNGSGTPDLNLTSQDTQNGGAAYADAIRIHGSNINVDWDDMYIDTANFQGDCYVATLSPDGAGASTQFTPSTGSNWQNVDELPADGDTTYNASSTAAHKDRFTHSNLPANADTVAGVQVSSRARKTDAGTRELRNVAYDGTTEGDGTLSHALALTYAWYQTMFEDHPTSAAAWSVSEVNSGEFGYKVQT